MDRVNGFLPADIRLHTMTKASKAFNAYANCTKRRYHYLLPTYVLMPEAQMTALLAAAMEAQGPIRGAGYEGGFVDPHSAKSLSAESLRALREQQAALRGFRVAAPTLAALRAALQLYCGTRSYHNFTSGKLPTDMSAQRYVLSFDCGEPFVFAETGVEWVQLAVRGQSFLIHQIRKMVGMAVEVARSAAPLDTIRDAFTTRKVQLLFSLSSH